MESEEIQNKHYAVTLGLDGYDSQAEHDKACDDFIYEQLNMTASCVEITSLEKAIRLAVEMALNGVKIDAFDHITWPKVDEIVAAVLKEVG